MARFLWPSITEQGPRLALILALSILMALLAAALPWPIKFLVDSALGDASLPRWLVRLLGDAPSILTLIALAGATLLCLRAAFAVSNASLDWMWEAAGQRMVYSLSRRVLSALQRKSLMFHFDRSPGDLMNRLSVDCFAVYTATAQLFVSPAKNLLTIGSVGAAAFVLSPALSLLLLATAPILAFSVWHFGGRIRHLAQGQRQAEAALATLAQNTLSTMPIVRNYALASHNDAQFDRLANRALAGTTALALGQGRYAMVNGIALAIGITIIIFAGSKQALGAALSVGSLMVLVAYIEVLRTAFMELLTAYGQVRSVEASVVRLLEVTDAGHDVVERDYAWPLTLASAEAGPHIGIENVSFGYKLDRPVLRDVTLEIEPGETLALVGETGSGKSTFCSLLPRFFDPDAGRILIDGQDLRDLTLESLRAKISIVMQDPFLMPLSVAENIAFGRPDASIEEIRRAAWLANASGFIDRLDHGFDTVLGEQGAGLSGGQRQRIAIARALLKQAPILLLDEPTSALDPVSEAKIVDALERLERGSTTIVIAHRLSTIRKADRIAVFDQGRIVECGTHDALLAQDGRFARYYRLHALTDRETGT